MLSEADLLIQHGAILPMDGQRTTLFDGALVIDKRRIVAVGPTDEVTSQYAGRKTIDAYRKAVLPGLIDTHHHFLQNFLRGSRDDLAFTDWIDQVSSPLIGMAVRDYLHGTADLQCHATRIGCAEALLSGITFVVNMEWATPLQVIDVYEEAGIRAAHTLTLTDVDEWGSPGMLLPLDMGLELAERLVARCRESDGGRVSFRYGPACENSASGHLLQEVRRRADKNSVGIHMHMAESDYGWNNIQRRYGKTPIRYLFDLGLLGPDVLGAHCIWLSDEDIDILKEARTAVSYNPECHMKLALGTARVARMLEKGVAVSLGTDTVAVNDNMDLFEAMRVGAFLQKLSTMNPAVVPAYEALEMGTIGGARALGMADEIGSLEPGKKADVILVDLSGIHMRPINHLPNNLVYAASAARDVETVIVDGRIVVHNRQLVSFDAQEAIAQAEAYAMRRFSQDGVNLSPHYCQGS
jgi:5-methylthioadenosine/S-adenosylhomocysteine deaminase